MSSCRGYNAVLSHFPMQRGRFEHAKGNYKRGVERR